MNLVWYDDDVEFNIIFKDLYVCVSVCVRIYVYKWISGKSL